MMLYSKILGTVSFVTCLGFFGLLIFVFTEADVKDYWMPLLLSIPLYAFVHFIIIHRFGFNYKAEFTKPQRLSILILSIIFSGTFLFLILPNINRFNREMNLEKDLALAKTWSMDTTAFDFTGRLITKYVEGKILFQLDVSSPIPFNPVLNSFRIHFFDVDGFYIDEIKITNFTQSPDDNGNVIGISSNSSEQMIRENYERLGEWQLVVYAPSK